MSKIGFLSPSSVIYPSISFDMINGIRLGLSDHKLKEIEIVTESIGIGADDKQIYSACEKLLMSGCATIAGYVNPTTAEKLQPLFESANAIFVALDSGYHYPVGMKKLENIFTISLQGALCCRLVALQAQHDGYKNFAYTGSFYDAGYRSTHAFFRSLEEEGGSVTFNHITQLKRSDFSLDPLIQHLDEPQAEAVLASFCGDMMQDLFAAAAQKNVFGKHPVYATSFMGEEEWLAKSVYPGRDIRTCVPWAKSLGNEVNIKFLENLTGKKQKANIFSVLGWEASVFIAAIVSAGNTEDSISALEGMRYEGPRGGVTIDAATHYVYAPVYDAWIKRDDNTGNCILEVREQSSGIEDQRKKLEADIDVFTGTATSWKNAYACLDS